MGTRVYLLDGGSLLMDRSLITWNHGMGTTQRIPVFSVLIDHPQGKILFDTGFKLEQAQRDLPFEQPLQSPEQTLPAQLERIGVRPQDIQVVINSHLHFDHCGGNELFKHARFIVNQHEYREAFAPEPFERLGYYRELFDFPALRWSFIEGDHEVAPGVQLLFTPGHAIGHYSLLVKLDSGYLLYTADAAWSMENYEKEHPMGLHHNPVDLVRSIRRLKQVQQTTGANLLLSHDGAVYEGYRKAPDFYA